MYRSFTFSVLFFISTVTLFGQDGSIVRCNEKLIHVIIEDIFSPPVASRVHVYPNLAAYEVYAQTEKNYPRFNQLLNDYPNIAAPTQKIIPSIAAVEAFCVVAKKLVYSEHLIEQFKTEEIQNIVSCIADTSLVTNSIKYGREVAARMIDYLQKDRYNYTRTMMRYELIDSPWAWRPTPPEYMNALEPNWPLMRSFFFDSASIIKPIPNILYSENKNEAYYKNAKNLYDVTKNMKTAEKAIALFWDDNPNTSISNGHMTYFIHKASPAGHWIRIAGIGIREKKIKDAAASKIYALLTLGIYEGFLSCWTEKYKSNAVRPETYIQRVIDPQWKPLIETPPFPEYTSGHSVISGVSSTLLTNLIGENFTYSDSTEMEYNLPSRKFKSFKDAAKEASISRFYGGIHYMPALDNGLNQGQQIGKYIIHKVIHYADKN